jgi:hypothetical protein
MHAKIQLKPEVCQLFNQNTGTTFSPETVYDAMESVFDPEHGLAVLLADSMGNVRTFKEIEFYVVNIDEMRAEARQIMSSFLPRPGLGLPSIR